MRRMRYKGTVIAVLVLVALTASVVLATNPLVDGNIALDDGWQGIAPVETDDNELAISEQYDIEDVYARSSDDDLTFFGGFEVFTDTMQFNTLASISFGFDTDIDSSTGGAVAEGACPNVGAEYRHDYLNFYGTILQQFYRWTGTGWEVLPSALAAHDADYEMMVNYADIGLTGPQAMAIGIYFENRADDPDDYVCFTWGGGQGCTPGYWRQPQHVVSWVQFSPDDSFFGTFGVIYDSNPQLKLGEAVWLKGGGEAALARHAVAALLNAAANSGVSYEYSVDEVIAMVKDAYATGDFEVLKDDFAAQNELGCPLD